MQKLSLYEHGVRAMVYADSPEKQQRVVIENQTKPLLRKMATSCFYGMVYRYPEVTKELLAAPYRMKGLNVLAFGRNSTVIQKDENVMKISRASEYMSHEQRGELIDELNLRHTTLRRYLGESCLDQVFQEVPHPLRQAPVVVAIQPFVQFEPFTSKVVYEDVKRAMLADFAHNSQQMDTETGLVNDVSQEQIILASMATISLSL